MPEWNTKKTKDYPIVSPIEVFSYYEQKRLKATVLIANAQPMVMNWNPETGENLCGLSDLADLVPLPHVPVEEPKTQRPLGYLAHPYSSDPEKNTENSMRVFSELMEICDVINPLLSHYHDANGPKKLTYDEWLEYDFALIERCDFVFRNPGESKGADAEVLFAVSKGIPVFSSYDQVGIFVKMWKEIYQ